MSAKRSAQGFQKKGTREHLARKGGLEVEQLVAQDWGGGERGAGESVDSIDAGMAACHAVHVAAACRCSASLTPQTPMRWGR